MTLHIKRDTDNSKTFMSTVPLALYLAGQAGVDFAEVEDRIVALSREAGKATLGAIAEKRDDGARSIRRDGHSRYRTKHTKGSFTCQFGVVEYRRPCYRYRGARNSVCPVDESLGLMAGNLTRHAAKVATHLRKASEHALFPAIWFAKWRDILQHERGSVERVIGALRGLCSRASTATVQKELKVELAYFRSNRHRMSYRDISQRGLPIESGIVEAVNKTHIGDRMKKSGMRWSVSGGQGILTIRSWVKSDRFDRIWNLVMADLVNGIPANDNCEPNHELALAA